MPKIYDCFTFFNELDLLEIRLNELDPVVDRFVLGEATHEHRGAPKRLYFRENRERFARFLPKIEHVVIDDLPGGKDTKSNYWRREKFQRRSLIRGLRNAHRDDFVIVSDIDEIPKASVVESAVKRPGRSVYAFEMNFYQFFVNLLLDAVPRWNKSRMIRFGDMRSTQALRSAGPLWTPAIDQQNIGRRFRHFKRMLTATRYPMRWTVLPDAGWHFSSMNGVAAVQRKSRAIIESIGNFSFDTPHSIAAGILGILKSGKGDAQRVVPFDDSFPAFMVAHRDRFAHLMADENAIAKLEKIIREPGTQVS